MHERVYAVFEFGVLPGEFSCSVASLGDITHAEHRTIESSIVEPPSPGRRRDLHRSTIAARECQFPFLDLATHTDRRNQALEVRGIV